MDEFDEKIFEDLSEKVEIPIRCEYTIRNALKNRKNKSTIKNILLTVIRICGVIFLTSGIVFASTKVYEKIWKKPKNIVSFYGTNGEWYSNDIDINKNNAITREQAKAEFENILKKFGYEDEIIISIELIDNPADDGMFYRATTDNKFLLDIDAKNPRNFKIFTNIAYTDIDKYRGTQKDVEQTIKNICEKYGYNSSEYNHKEVKYNISNGALENYKQKGDFHEKDKPEDANIWAIKYNKEYNGIVNIYEELEVGIIPEINELYYFIYTNKSPENTEIIIKEDEAKKIALEKEEKLDLGYKVKNTEAKLDIVKMNGNEYMRENNFKQYYEQSHTENYPIDKIQYYCVEEKIREVWKIKLEFEITNDFEYKEDSFTYFIDVTTGEIIGGE